jgi:hypothetical protein
MFRRIIMIYRCELLRFLLFNSYAGTDLRSASLAMTNGHLPYISSDRTIEQASTSSNPYNLPPTLHQAIVVQMFCNKVHSAMGDLDRSGASASRPKRASSLRLLEVDFQELERRLGPSRSRKYSIPADLVK